MDEWLGPIWEVGFGAESRKQRVFDGVLQGIWAGVYGCSTWVRLAAVR